MFQFLIVQSNTRIFLKFRMEQHTKILYSFLSKCLDHCTHYRKLFLLFSVSISWWLILRVHSSFFCIAYFCASELFVASFAALTYYILILQHRCVSNNNGEVLALLKKFFKLSTSRTKITMANNNHSQEIDYFQENCQKRL